MASEFYKKITASCPGSLMIMGEHAVLDGSSAVVAAIDKYLTVELTVESKVNADKSSNFTIRTEKDSEKLIFISELDN
ncbi:MAG: hypothetical protein KBD64_02480, partial [Gammaproteobacteria bacterium]|nr:hypothetical protein [Gammaproteobacteria bacterium]